MKPPTAASAKPPAPRGTCFRCAHLAHEHSDRAPHACIECECRGFEHRPSEKELETTMGQQRMPGF